MTMMGHGTAGQGAGEGAMAGMDAMGNGTMAMGMGHLNDVEFDAYLANDRTLDDPEVVTVEPGGNVRLRIINGAASTNFWIDLGALEGDLLAVDGSHCDGADGSGTLRGRLFPLAMSQRVDIALTRLAPGAYPILARREGDAAQTGIILATPGASISQVSPRARAAPPVLSLDLERSVVAHAPLSSRAADRHHMLQLTGNMMGFVWGLNGRKYGEHRPLQVRKGERAEIEMVNRTDMSHPMHLHGHTFQVVEIGGQRLNGPMRDTVLVPVNGRVTIAFDADNPGRWAFHCHNLYHMAAGMMTTLEYEG
jgi:FtsP/CotA-like multicopper oxidase with cupredoxin domain